MSRIHEALKRAEQEKGKTPSPEPEVLAPETISTVATAVATPPPPPQREATPALLQSCRSPRWLGDTSKLFFLASTNHSFATEQLRTLRSRLYQIRDRMPLKIVMVTSPMPAEGKTFLCANLAHAFMRQHERRILLVDADLRRSRLHSILGAPAEPGLTEYFRGEARLEDILQRGPQDNLYLIPGGKQSEHPAELLATNKLKDLLDRVAPLFDWIILDTPPAGPVSDPSIIADCCDGVLLVVNSGTTPHDMAQRVTQDLREKRLLGVVLNRAEPSDAGSTYYANYYGYGTSGDPTAAASQK
jgi:capsular exopolysaccharide synthesis family protein